MTHYIGILSGKGGVGKTSSSINLGAALNFFGKDVTIVDANLSTPNIGLYLGAPVVPINLHHALNGKHHITEAVYLHPAGIKIVPAGISVDELMGVNPDKLNKVIKGLENTTDIVIVDGAAGLGREANATFESADKILIVTNPEIPAITDALKTIKIAEEFGKEVVGVILCRTKPNNLDVSLKNIETILEKPVIGIIPEDKSVREALVKKDSVVYTHPNSKASIGYKKLAANLIGERYKPEDIKENFMLKVLRVLRLK
jgi:septum site-determining protein MinD